MENIMETGRAYALSHPFPIMEVLNFPGYMMRWTPEVPYCGFYQPTIESVSQQKTFPDAG